MQDGTINFSASSLVSLLHRALFTAPYAPSHGGPMYGGNDMRFENLVQRLRDAQQVARDLATIIIVNPDSHSRQDRANWLEMCAMVCLQQVRDARPVALDLATILIRNFDVDSPQDAANWLQLCAALCLHYDAQQNEEQLWQCVDTVLVRIRSFKEGVNPVGIMGIKTALFDEGTPAGFIRILKRARHSEWQNRLLFERVRVANMVTTLKQAIRHVEAGRQLEKTAQQAAAEFLLARYHAHTAPAIGARPRVEGFRSEPVAPPPFWIGDDPGEVHMQPIAQDSNVPTTTLPLEDMLDITELIDSWWQPDSGKLTVQAGEPAGSSISNTTTTTTLTLDDFWNDT